MPPSHRATDPTFASMHTQTRVESASGRISVSPAMAPANTRSAPSARSTA